MNKNLNKNLYEFFSKTFLLFGEVSLFGNYQFRMDRDSDIFVKTFAGWQRHNAIVRRELKLWKTSELILPLNPIREFEEFLVRRKRSLPIKIIDSSLMPGEYFPYGILIGSAYFDIMAVGIRLPLGVKIKIFQSAEHLVAASVAVNKKITVFSYIFPIAVGRNVNPTVDTLVFIKIMI